MDPQGLQALNKLRIGSVDDAFAYEKHIEEALEQQTDRDWHITYINYINKARLFKREKDYNHAEVYYNKAFSVIAQLRNESDLLYSNFCYAQLEELRGNDKRAFLFFLRASLHWLSNEIPEALAPRVAQALLGRSIQSSRVDVDEISHQLSKRLQRLALKLNILPLNQPISPAIFTRSDRITFSPDRILGQPGWSVCLSDQILFPVYSGYRYNELSGLVTKVIQSLFPDVHLSRYRTIVTDTQFSCELPADLIGMMLLARRLNILTLNWCDKVIKLTEQDLKTLSLRLRVEISPAVSFVSYQNRRMKVHYKRYKPPLLLSPNETRVIEFLNDVGSCPLQKLETSCDLDDLQEKRVVQLFYE